MYVLIQLVVARDFPRTVLTSTCLVGLSSPGHFGGGCAHTLRLGEKFRRDVKSCATPFVCFFFGDINVYFPILLSGDNRWHGGSGTILQIQHGRGSQAV